MRERDHTIYWATLPGEELVPHLTDKVEAYHRYLEHCGLWDLWQRAHSMYQWGSTSNTILNVGEEGEFDGIIVNHFRNILRHIYVGTTGTRPGFQMRAVNTDYKSRIAVRLGDGVLEFYLKQKRCEQKQRKKTETSIEIGEGYTFSWWDPNAGKIVGSQPVPPAEGDDPDAEPKERPIFEGDIRVENPHPVDVIRDVTRHRWDGMPWWIIRRRVNRFDLAALHPEQAEDILQLDEANDEWDEKAIRLLEEPSEAESDDVCVYHFIHERTPALPTGRFVTFVGEDIVLEDSALDDLPQDPLLDRLAGDEIEGAPFGYTFAFDLMALQDAINTGHSTALTNVGNFGVTNLTGPAGGTVKFEKLTKGLNFVALANAREGRIEALDLLQIPTELVNIVQLWENAMETLSGVNSVARGNPEASLKSGAALALVQSQFLQFTQDFQAAYFDSWGEFTTGIVRLFRANVSEKRLAAIVGKGDRAYVKELMGKDLENIDRVEVEPASALARTTAGRLQIAEDLLAAGFVQSPEQYMAVRETGRLEPMTHHPTAQLDLIQAENEALMEGNAPVQTVDEQGQPVLDQTTGLPMETTGARVVAVDDHVLHIKEHHALTCDPDVRRNETVMSAVLAHILEHMNELLSMDPVLAALLGMPNVAGASPAPGAPPSGSAPSPGGGSPETQAAVNPATGGPAQVRKPTNPQTGQEWNSEDGGVAA